MKDFLKKIYSLISAMLTAFSDSLQSAHEQKQQQQLLMQEYRRADYIRSVMYEMQNDLFPILGKRHYRFLNSILAPADIRVAGYKVRGNGIIYEFQLEKSAETSVDSTILQRVQQNMNADIQQAQYHLGTHGSLADYPFLAYGLKVVGIKDVGLALQVSVVTNYPV